MVFGWDNRCFKFENTEKDIADNKCLMIEGQLWDTEGKFFGVSLILVYASLVPAERNV